MKSTIQTLFLAIAMIGYIFPSAFAQDAEEKTALTKASVQDKTQANAKPVFIVEIDPLPYLWGGAGGHFGWTPKNSRHFSFGVGFIAGPEFPDAFNNMNRKNKDQGWNMKINQGAAVWTHYYFKQPNKGWFSGLQLITQEMKLTNDNFPGESDRTNTLMLALSTGYVLYPIRKTNLYLRPWAGLGFQKVISTTFEPDEVTPEMVVGNKEYHLSGVLPFATIHIGYRF